MLVGMKSGKMVLRFGPYALPDEDLKKLRLPTLLIYGDKEVMYEVVGAVKRAEELVENIQTVLIPNASHMVHFEQTKLVNSHILNFLSGDK
jgi:pimeloyl-ACP methyl ester carboxylesterase